MKISSLLENKETSNDRLRDEWANYIYSDMFLTLTNYHEEFLQFMRLPDGRELPGLKFFGRMSDSKKTLFMNNWGDYLAQFDYDVPHGVRITETASICSFKELGQPPFKIISAGTLDIDGNPAKTVEDWLPTTVNQLAFSWCEIESLQGIEKIVKKCKTLTFRGCPIKSHLLGIFQIPGVARIRLQGNDGGITTISIKQNEDLEDLINQFLRERIEQDLDIFDAQEMLISNGFGQFAEL